jgi:hypothetical protein
VDFDDGRYLTVRPGGVARRANREPAEPSDGQKGEEYNDCITVLGWEDGQVWESAGAGGTEEENALVREEIAKDLPHLDSDDGRKWVDSVDNEVLTLQDVCEKYEMRLKHRFPGWYAPWLRELQGRRLTAFFDTDRIEMAKMVLGGHAVFPRSSRGLPDVPCTPLEWSADFVQTELKEARQAAFNTMMDLDMDFRDKVLTRLQANDEAAPTVSGLRQQVSELAALRGRLWKAGLMDESDDASIPSEVDFPDAARKVLGLHIENVRVRLEGLEPLLAKIELFKRIMNARFARSGKRLADDLNTDFKIETPYGQIDPVALSSGEKQYLVLFLNILFGMVLGSSTLVLIDEPELSMHIAWQQKFLKDLAAVAKLTDLQFLIATHSPDIIYDRWDLTVELKGKGPDEEEH